MGAHSTINVTKEAARKAWVEREMAPFRKKLMAMSMMVGDLAIEQAADIILDGSLYNCVIVPDDYEGRDGIQDYLLEQCIEHYRESNG